MYLGKVSLHHGQKDQHIQKIFSQQKTVFISRFICSSKKQILNLKVSLSFIESNT